jgi:hypothetical protein
LRPEGVAVPARCRAEAGARGIGQQTHDGACRDCGACIGAIARFARDADDACDAGG